MRPLRFAARATWLLVAFVLASRQLPGGERVANSGEPWSLTAAVSAIAYPVARQAEWRAPDAPRTAPARHAPPWWTPALVSPLAALQCITRPQFPTASTTLLGYSSRGTHRPYDSAAPPLI